MSKQFVLMMDEETARHSTLTVYTLGETLRRISEIDDEELEDEVETLHSVYTTQVMALSSRLLDNGWSIYIYAPFDQEAYDGDEYWWRNDHAAIKSIYYGMELANGQELERGMDLKELLLKGLLGDDLIGD